MKIVSVILPLTFLFNLACHLQPRDGMYTVGDFMTKKEVLHVVNATTTVDEGIVILGFLYSKFLIINSSI